MSWNVLASGEAPSKTLCAMKLDNLSIKVARTLL